MCVIIDVQALCKGLDVDKPVLQLLVSGSVETHLYFRLHDMHRTLYYSISTEYMWVYMSYNYNTIWKLKNLVLVLDYLFIYLFFCSATWLNIQAQTQNKDSIFFNFLSKGLMLSILRVLFCIMFKYNYTIQLNTTTFRNCH